MTHQLALFASTALPALRQRFLIGYRSVEQVIYPATPHASHHLHREALYISPEGLYRLHWWQVTTASGRCVIDVQTWYTPIPKPGRLGKAVARRIAPAQLRGQA